MIKVYKVYPDVMNIPGDGDYINIHDHGPLTTEGIFSVDNIMVHEGRSPSDMPGVAFSVGAHPWAINEENGGGLMLKVRDFASHPNVIAIGETGFDKLKGPGPELQWDIFRQHVELSEDLKKPLIIHCVRSYEEVLSGQKKFKPSMPWIIHGFKGKPELARQLTGKGLYLSAWVEWAVRPVSAETLRTIPPDMLFLETDGFDISIIPVYQVVAGYLGIDVKVLKENILRNYFQVFKQ